ncbi:phage portal protein [Rhodococcus ruber]|uniref:phage portal protein n=1 Tax=Rhodococcus ruber TaxID=1830 RepID=UPI003D817BAA
MGAIARFFGFEVETRSGSEGSAGGDSPLPGVTPPPRALLPAVIAREALRVSVVSRAVDQVNTMIGGLTLDAYDSRGIKLPSPPAILAKPSLETDYEEFLQQSINDFLLFGEFFWYLTPGYNGAIADLRVLPPDSVTVTLDPLTGVRGYGWSHGTVPRSRIIHKRHTTLSDEPRGRGPVQAAQTELRLALAVQAFQQGWFDGGAPPEGVLSTDQNLNDMQREAINAQWKAFLANPTNRTAILSNGIDYKALVLKPAEAQMLEVADAIDRKLARIFGIGAHDMLVPLEGESRTYVNLETANLDFLVKTLQKTMNAIERAFTQVLPGMTTVRFNERGLLRLDSKTQAEIDKIRVDTGYTTANELRERDGLAPLPAPQFSPARPRPQLSVVPSEEAAQ